MIALYHNQCLSNVVWTATLPLALHEMFIPVRIEFISGWIKWKTEWNGKWVERVECYKRGGEAWKWAKEEEEEGISHTMNRKIKTLKLYKLFNHNSHEEVDTHCWHSSTNQDGQKLLFGPRYTGYSILDIPARIRGVYVMKYDSVSI